MNPRTTLHALAWSLPDVQPTPQTTRLASTRGEAPGAWTLCQPCDGTGHDRYRRPCPTCHGAGRYRIDPITLQPVASHDSQTTTEPRTTTCDRCAGTGIIPKRWLKRNPGVAGRAEHRMSADVSSLSREAGMVRCPPCDGTGRRTLPRRSSTGTPPALLDDGTPLARLRAMGSWGELEAALEHLRRTDRAAWSAWTRARVGVAPPERPRQGASPRPRGVSPVVSSVDSWLVSLPVVWRCPGVVLVAWRAAGERGVVAERLRRGRVFRPGVGRDGRIRELVGGGLSCGEVAVELGVSASTVSRALRVAA